MNKKNIFYAALLLMAIGAEAKEIKGKVMADGKGLAKVVVTDGTAFALTSEDGSYMIDADGAGSDKIGAAEKINE